MSAKQRRAVWPILVVSALSLSVFAFALAHKTPGHLETRLSVQTDQNPIALSNAASNNYVRVGRLWPQLRWNLKALGDRVEKPGKERLTMVGSLSRANEAQPVSVLLLLEFPDRLRLEMQILEPHRIITFNG